MHTYDFTSDDIDFNEEGGDEDSTTALLFCFMTREYARFNNDTVKYQYYLEVLTTNNDLFLSFWVEFPVSFASCKWRFLLLHQRC